MKSFFTKLTQMLGVCLLLNAPLDPIALASEPLQTVEHVDLDRYMGRWYEIASFPKWFSYGCVNSQATYSLRDDGNVTVVNECHKRSATGRLSQVKGVARALDPSNAKLKVKFPFNPFEGDYWVIELGENYEYAVVSEPERKSLWILSRSEEMNADTYEAIKQTLITKHGFDLNSLRETRSVLKN